MSLGDRRPGLGISGWLGRRGDGADSRLKVPDLTVDGAGTPSEGGRVNPIAVVFAMLCCVACYTEAGRFRERYGRTPFGWSQGLWAVVGLLLSILGICLLGIAERIGRSAAAKQPAGTVQKSSQYGQPGYGQPPHGRPGPQYGQPQQFGQPAYGQAPYGSAPAAYAPPAAPPTWGALPPPPSGPPA